MCTSPIDLILYSDFFSNLVYNRCSVEIQILLYQKSESCDISTTDIKKREVLAFLNAWLCYFCSARAKRKDRSLDQGKKREINCKAGLTCHYLIIVTLIIVRPSNLKALQKMNIRDLSLYGYCCEVFILMFVLNVFFTYSLYVLELPKDLFTKDFFK